jgi:5-methylcytosine-specific restriction protein A
MFEQDKKNIYKYALQVYNKKITYKEASAQIEAEWMTKEEFNENSVKDYISALRHMLNGTRHTRGISTELREFFLEKILDEFGVERLETALAAYMKHIEYYEESHNTHRKIEREIHDKFLKISKNGDNCNTEMIPYLEGGREQKLIFSGKRSRAARQECIEKYGAVCALCGFDFEKQYGELGKGFIHVHHLVPLSTKTELESITADDLRPVCPNCHAMLHKGKNPPTIEELKKLIKH